MWGSYSSRSSIVVSYLSKSSYVAKRSTACDARSPYGIGCRTTTTLLPWARKIPATRREVWLFPLPVRTAHRDDGHLRLQHRLFGAEEEEFRPMRVREGDPMPDVRVVDVGVRQDALLGTEPLDQPRELFFRKNRDSFGIQVPREGGRILPSLDARDLRGGKRDDVVRRIVAEIDVERMEVPAHGA